MYWSTCRKKFFTLSFFLQLLFIIFSSSNKFNHYGACASVMVEDWIAYVVVRISLTISLMIGEEIHCIANSSSHLHYY